MDILAFLIAVFFSIPLWVIGTECLVILLAGTKFEKPPSAPKPSSYKILIPAHNEAKIIEKTLSGLIAELPGNTPADIVLVADNCSDDTAVIARRLGVTVLEREATEQRGKGYALDFGVQHLAATGNPDIVVIMDADCETTQASLTELIHAVAQDRKPAQMTYLMRTIENASIKQKISGFAWLLKNKIRLQAMNRLGLPVTLTGTGMAFPWEALKTVKLGHGNIVEDMQLGIDLAINGFPPVFCPEALVYSDFPELTSAELSQRTRWEHGHLQTIFRQVPQLIREAMRRNDWRLFALALDIGVPPLSLTVMLALFGLFLLTLLMLISGYSTAFLLLLVNFSYFAVTLTGIWRVYGQDYLSAHELLGIPLYIISKLTIYKAFIKKRQKEWIRTDRNS